MSLSPSAMIPRISWSLAPVLRASNRRCAYAGGRWTGGRRKRPSSGGAVGVAVGAVEPEACRVFHGAPAGGGGLLLPAFADLWLPALAYRFVDFRGDVGAGGVAGAAAGAGERGGGGAELA